MPTKIYHPNHGFVLSGDDVEIKRLVDAGGVIVKKNKDIEPKIEEVEEPENTLPMATSSELISAKANVTKPATQHKVNKRWR